MWVCTCILAYRQSHQTATRNQIRVSVTTRMRCLPLVVLFNLFLQKTLSCSRLYCSCEHTVKTDHSKNDRHPLFTYIFSHTHTHSSSFYLTQITLNWIICSLWYPGLERWSARLDQLDQYLTDNVVIYTSLRDTWEFCLVWSEFPELTSLQKKKKWCSTSPPSVG